MKSSENHPIDSTVHIDEFVIGVKEKAKVGRSYDSKKKNVVTVDDKNRYNEMVTKQDENKCQVSLMGESINQIRICLNKLTEKTYSTVEGKIIDLMTQIINNEDLTESELLQIGKHVFEIASSNKFYSFLYATLLKKILCLMKSLVF